MARKRNKSEAMADRFSDLPDQVAQHILSFLSITDLARVCCVSKRCAERCMSTSALNFDGFSSDWKSTCYKRLQLLTYLERFLFSRGDNKIQSFRVNWERHYVDGNETPCICDSEHYRMITWIKRAVRCNVEMLDLKMTLYDSKEAAFPFCIFLCGSLRALKVDMDFTLLRTPSFAFSSNLNYLKLRSVVIEDERFFKWISSSCKFLQELHLKELCGTETISIESSSLKRLEFFGVFNVSHLNIAGEKLEDISIGWLFESPSNKSFNISAPNLKSLSWMGKLASHTNLGKFKSLQVAILFLEPKEDDLQNVYDVFCSLCKVKILMLDEATVKVKKSRTRQTEIFLFFIIFLCMAGTMFFLQFKLDIHFFII